MRLIIEGKTNRDDVMVNTAKVTLPSGDVYTIDRDCTEYTIDTVTGYLSMTWDDPDYVVEVAEWSFC